jgi:OPT family oligopeptide transporter
MPASPEAQDPEKPYRAPAPPAKEAIDPEVEWFQNVYRGNIRQFTLRSFLVGSVIGAVMCLSNLYVGLKTGWGLGVAITACILSYAVISVSAPIFSRIGRGTSGWLIGVGVFVGSLWIPGLEYWLLASRIGRGPAIALAIVTAVVLLAITFFALPRLFGTNLTILENNAMQSTASSASTGTIILVSAISALLLVTGHQLHMAVLMGWLFFMVALGTIMAIPMKRQIINIEKLRFPSGTAAAETLRSLYGAGGEAVKKARSLFAMLGLGSLVTWLRDAHGTPAHPVLAAFTKLSKIPALIPIPFVKIRGLSLLQYTISFEGSLIMVAAGMLMGLRTTISMLIGGLINYGIIAPIALDHGVIHTHLDAHHHPALGYPEIVHFSLWPGAALMVTSGLLTFGLQWRTVLRAFSGLGKLLKRSAEHHDAASADPVEKARGELEKIEVPSSWFVIGTIIATTGLVIIGYIAFHISPLLGVVSVVMAFMLAIVACRATGETDITPVGAMGKITQLAYGVLAPTNITTNLMTASVTAGTAGASADLLNDLKSGYLLGANPRQQFLAQLSGTLVGTLVSVPVFYVLVPTPAALGTDRFPAPSAQVWKGVAELLAHGVHSLHPWMQWGIVIGGAIGIVIPLLELWLPKYKKWIPSATGLGLALVIPCFNSVSMFIGALIAYLWSKYKTEHGERYITPVASGIIAGESLLGVVVALLSAGGYLQ